MSRLTPEREAEIRGIRNENREECHWGHVGDLLAELDAVRAERDAMKWMPRDEDENSPYVGIPEKQLNKLQAERDRAYDKHDLILERDSLQDQLDQTLARFYSQIEHAKALEVQLEALTKERHKHIDNNTEITQLLLSAEAERDESSRLADSNADACNALSREIDRIRDQLKKSLASNARLKGALELWPDFQDAISAWDYALDQEREVKKLDAQSRVVSFQKRFKEALSSDAAAALLSAVRETIEYLNGSDNPDAGKLYKSLRKALGEGGV